MAPSSRIPRILTARSTAAPRRIGRGFHPGPGAGRQPGRGGQRTQPHRTVRRASPEIRRWSWPKGKVDPNESHRHAAVREIGEESGLSVKLGPYPGDIGLPAVRRRQQTAPYQGSVGGYKHIQFWMATPISAIDNLRRTHAFGPVHRADIGEIDELFVADAGRGPQDSAIPPIRTSSRYSLIGCRRARLTRCR